MPEGDWAWAGPTPKNAIAMPPEIPRKREFIVHHVGTSFRLSLLIRAKLDLIVKISIFYGCSRLRRLTAKRPQIPLNPLSLTAGNNDGMAIALPTSISYWVLVRVW